MSLFRHPHLTRGIIRTPYGSFTITRGIVDVPEEIGFALGWHPVDEEGESREPLKIQISEFRLQS